jgi:molybdopterin-guanine dinucleotide biosynthesis protein A
MDAGVTRVAAVILAGGKGERLGGVNKALLTIGGERLVDRAMAVTSGCSPRLLAVGQAGFEAPADLVQVLDLETDYAGPLAGVAAALDHLAGGGSEVLLSLAVDSPLFPRDFLARALPLLNSASAVVAAYGEQEYPTNALWRIEAIAGLPAAIREGTGPRSLKRLAERLGAVRLDYAPFTDSDPFRNANTPEDLAFLRQVLSRGGAG